MGLRIRVTWTNKLKIRRKRKFALFCDGIDLTTINVSMWNNFNIYYALYPAHSFFYALIFKSKTTLGFVSISSSMQMRRDEKKEWIKDYQDFILLRNGLIQFQAFLRAPRIANTREAICKAIVRHFKMGFKCCPVSLFSVRKRIGSST